MAAVMMCVARAVDIFLFEICNNLAATVIQLGSDATTSIYEK